MRTAGILGSVLLFLTLLTPGADAVYVTAGPCQRPHRLRKYPVDNRATTLDMESCRLTEFKLEYINGLTNITKIDLYNNSLEYADLAIFRSVPTLETLDLGFNKLRVLPVFPINSCPSLTHLRLERNKLTEIIDASTFAACAQLEHITLEDNNINYIHPDVFNSLPNLSWLTLRYNRLTFVPDRMFAESTSRPYLKLFVSSNKLTYLPDNFASSLVERGGASFNQFQFGDNPWQCACLLELLGDVKRAGVQHYESYMEYRGTSPACVFRGPVPCARAHAPGLLHQKGQ